MKKALILIAAAALVLAGFIACGGNGKGVIVIPPGGDLPGGLALVACTSVASTGDTTVKGCIVGSGETCDQTLARKGGSWSWTDIDGGSDYAKAGTLSINLGQGLQVKLNLDSLASLDDTDYDLGPEGDGYGQIPGGYKSNNVCAELASGGVLRICVIAGSGDDMIVSGSWTFVAVKNNCKSGLASAGTFTRVPLQLEVSLSGCDTATLTADVTGGIPPYTYQWQACCWSDVDGATSSSITPGNCTGSHRVVVTDSAGNTATSSSCSVACV